VLAGKVALLRRKAVKNFDHEHYDAIHKSKVHWITKKVWEVVNRASTSPRNTKFHALWATRLGAGL
jgi:hypothetical protein